MDLKSIINKTKEKKDAYWALLIEPGWVSAAIWEVAGEEVNITCEGPATKWEDENGLIESSDTALSSCISKLPEEYTEPEKTVFGLSSSWIEGGNIKEQHLGSLKKICDELSLTPSGFVVFPEAIAHYIKSEEGSPLSGIIVGLSEQNLEISLFKLGKLAGTFSVSRSVSVADDLVEGLARFGGSEVFPSRILIYDGKEADLEDTRNSLSEASWDGAEKVKFLHPPKVDIIKPEDKIRAVCLAGGSEIAGVTKLSGSEDQKFQEDEPENIPEDAQNVEPVSEREGNEALTAQDLGFVVNEVDTNQGTEQPRDNFGPEPQKKPRFKINLPSFKIPKPKIGNNMKFNKSPLLVGGISLAVFIAAAFSFWWFYPTALVTVYVSPKKLEETLDVNLGEDLPSNDLSVDVSGEKTKSTTGVKTVGDRAKGSVKIQNGTAVAIKLDSGTVVVSSGGLEFELDESASVSAALSPSSPGTATINVTASAIGSEYNLAKDEVFKVGNYPKADVDAVSTDNFSGGSSREISAVSKDDILELEKSLTSELLDQAKEELSKEISSDEILIESSLTEEVGEKDFSNKEGDEASTLKLKLSMSVTGKVVSKKDLVKKSSEALSGKVPAGFVLRDDQISYSFSQNSGDKNNFEVGVSVNLLPNVDVSEVTKKVVGKYPELAQEYLSGVPGFVRAEFRIKPLFPGKLGTLPHLAKRIEVQVSADR